MKCPLCENDDTSVLESREAPEAVRRRRTCNKCEARFTTYERIEQPPITVRKRDGSTQPFSRDKLRMGLIKACNKRPVSAERIERVVEGIEGRLRRKKSAEVQSRLIGSLMLRELRKLDPVAYLRFASVYHEYNDAQSFIVEAKHLTQEGYHAKTRRPA